MKSSTLLLSLSLLANGILAAVVIVKKTHTPAAYPVASPEFHPASDNGDNTSAGSFEPHPQLLAAATNQPTAWSHLHSENPDELISRLKAAGFSFREIRAIVLPLAQKKFEALRAEVMGKQEEMPFWRGNSSRYATPEDPAQRAKFAELMQQQSKVYQKFFSGAEALADDDQMRQFARRQFGDLPLEKLQQLSKVQRDYQELRSEIYMASQKRARPELTPEDKKQLALLDSELHRDLQQTLTPEEYSEYQLRNSPTAHRLRQQLDLFRPTEAEYKALFALQRPLDEEFNQMTGDAETHKARSEAMKKLEPQILTALGAERYADYQQALRSGNDKVTRLVARLDLPLRTIGQINAVQTDITRRAQTLRADPALSPAERDLHLSALAQEARTKLSNTLGGQRGLEAYADIKGDWLRTLHPKPVPSSP